MGTAKYIGRVGGLAVALGVGVAIATTPGVAWAEPDSTSSSSSESSTSGSSSESSTSGSSSEASTSGSTGDSTSTSPAESSTESQDSSADSSSTTSEDSTPSTGEMKVDSIGGALTSTTTGSDTSETADDAAGTDEDPATTAEEPEAVSAPTVDTSPPPSPVAEPVPSVSEPSIVPESPKPQPISEPDAKPRQSADAAAVADSKKAPSSAGAAASVYETSQVRRSLSTAAVIDQPAAAAIPAPTMTTMSAGQITAVETQAVPAVFSGPLTPLNVVAGVVSNVLSDGPAAPVDSPVGWAVLALVRSRRFEQAVVEEAPGPLYSPTLTSQTTDAVATADQKAFAAMAMAATNTAPVVTGVTTGSPDQSTGAITGAVTATDQDGNALLHSLSGPQPAGGSVSVNADGTFSYTPSESARLAAGPYSTVTFDRFTVAVSDGQATTTTDVSVPVLPTVLNNEPSRVTGANPYGVVVVGRWAYVANQGANTVTAIDTLNPNVSQPVTVGSAPTSLVASPSGSLVYVTNRTSGTVSVIRTSDNTVVGAPITVGSQPESITVNATGTRVYVANYGSNNVSVIDTTTSTPKVIATIAVGANPRGIAFAQTVNGSRVYVVNSTAGTVSVINTATNTVVDTNPTTKTIDPIRVGSTPQQVAVSPDGKWAYVTNYGFTNVSVINTATNRVDGSPIAAQSTPVGVAVSADGSLLYVANGNDRVTIFDTRTRLVHSVVQIDQAPETNFHTIALGPDGSLYVTDYADPALRVVSSRRGNTAPVAIADPTVGTADPTNGAIAGLVNIKDWDDDVLTYSVPTQPASGTVTVTTNGVYTYTPTQAARERAWTKPETVTFTVTATDGQYTTAPIRVTVPISALPPRQVTASTTPITVGTNPSDVVVSGNHAYVANVGSNTVSVVDTGTKRVVATIPVGTGPNSLVATPHGNRVYVANSAYNGDNTVSVIDTTANTVVATIPIPNPHQPTYGYELAISPDGKRVYVADRYSSRISVIDTDPTSLTYNKVIRTANVGYLPGNAHFTVSPDGTRLYMSTDSYGNVNVVDTASMTVVDTIDVSDPYDSYYPDVVAFRPDGQRGYAAAGYVSEGGMVFAALFVIDTFDPTSPTYNEVVATIGLPTDESVDFYTSYGGKFDVAFSPDGSRAYVTSFDGKTITVIDTTTDTIAGSFKIDEGSGDLLLHRSVAVAADGTLFVTDMDGTIYAVTVVESTTAV